MITCYHVRNDLFLKRTQLSPAKTIDDVMLQGGMQEVEAIQGKRATFNSLQVQLNIIDIFRKHRLTLDDG